MSLTTAWAVDLSPTTHQAVPGDFNGDGRVDALLQPLVTGGQGAILLRDGTGNLSVLAQGWDPGYLGLDWSAANSAITTGDLNGDGRDDVVIQPRTPGKNTSVLITDPTSQLLKVEQVIPAGYLGLDWSTGGHVLVPGDFDGDRQKELLLQAVQPGDTSAIVHADTAGHLVAVTQLIPASYLGRRWDAQDVTLYVGDFNGDGRQDLLMQVNAGAEKAGEPTYALLLADPNGQFTQIAQVWNSSDFGADWSPATHTLSLQDLNGTGVMSIVLTSKDPNGTNYVFEPNGQGLIDKAAARWTGPQSARDALARQTGSRGISVVTASTTTSKAATPATTQTSMQTAMVRTAMVGNGPQTVNSVGTMGGQSGVEGGSGTYSIPIAVPPGIAGVQPALSLNYSSHGGNGEMGMGWSLSGTSSIHRCPATYAQDGFSQGVTYTPTDRYCLDGQHLIYVGSGAYRTERDSSVRVTALNGGSNTIYFEVDYQDGRKSYYGVPNTGSQFVAQWPSNAVAPFPTLVWAISRTDYPVGASTYNNITYSYRNFGNGEYHLSAINYTGKTTSGNPTPGNREVDFTYTTRTDPSTAYLAGASTAQTQLLTLITTKVSGTEVHHYNLSYAPSAATGRSLLRSAQECGYATGSTTLACLPAAAFSWQEPTPGFSQPTSLSGLLSGVSTESGGNSDVAQDMDLTTTGDYNGDGQNELFFASSDGYAFSADGTVKIDMGAVFGGPNYLGNGQSEDFMRNGLADAMGVTPAGHVQISTCIIGHPCTSASDFNTPMDTGIVYGGPVNIITGEFSGDGLPDIIVQNSTTNPALYLYQNTTKFSSGNQTPSFSTNGIQLASLQQFTANCLYTQTQTFSEIGDMDGDGVPDILINGGGCGDSSPAAIVFVKSLLDAHGNLVISSTTSSLASLGINLNNEHGIYPTIASLPYYTFADINGDGLKDFVYVGAPDSGSGPATWHYQLNQGGGFGFAPEVDTQVSADYDDPNTGYTTAFESFQTGDFTAEGKDEFLVPVSMVSTYCELNKIISEGVTQTDMECPAPDHDHNVYAFHVLKFVQNSSGTYVPTVVTNGSSPVTVNAEAGTTKTADLYGMGMTDLLVLYSRWYQNAFFNDVSVCSGITPNPPCEPLPGAGYFASTPTGDAKHPLGLVPDMMTAATNELGAQAAWEYHSLAELHSQAYTSVPNGPMYTVDHSAGHTQCSTASNVTNKGPEYYCFASSMWVVSNYTVSNGVGGLNSYNYQYSDAIYEDQGRGFQGFNSITVIDQAADTQTVNTYHQDFPLSGMLVESKISQISTGTLLSDTTNTWASASPTGCLASSAVFFTQLQNSETKKYNAPSGFLMSDTASHYTYDADGNVKTSDTTVKSTDGQTLPGDNTPPDVVETIEVTTTNNYNASDCANWWTDQLSQKIVSTTTSYKSGFLAATPPATSTIVHSADYTYNNTLRKIATEDDDLGTTLAPYGIPNYSAYEKKAAYGYDGFGNLTSTTMTTGVPQPSGTLSTTQDYGFAGSRQTSTVYNTDGYFPQTVTDSLGHVTTITSMDPGKGKPTSVTGPDGVVTTHSYDAFGRPLSEQAGDMNLVSISYGAPSTLCGTAVYMSSATQTGAAGKYACYDMLNRAVLSYVDGFSAGVQFQSQTIYNNLGQVKQASEPFSQQDPESFTTYTYDALNRVLTKVTPTGVTARYSYGVGPGGSSDPLATQIVVTTTDGSPTTTSYEIHDSPGKLLSTTDTNGSETDFYYDAGGNPVLIRDAAGNQTLASYNILGQKISVSDPDQGTSTFVYDVLGELLQQTDAKAQKTSMSYDNGGRMTSRSFPALVSGSTITVADVWCYDGASLTPGTSPSPGTCGTAQNGSATGKVSAVGQYDGYHESYAYDQDGRLASTDENINSNDYITTTSYDSDGRVSTVSYPATIVDTALNPTITPSATTVQTGTVVTLTGAATNGNSSSTMALSYQWSVVSSQCGGCTPSLTSTTTAATQFTPSVPGTYTFIFTVNDGLQTASAQVTITVQPAAPGTLSINSNTGVVGTYNVNWGTSSNGTSYNLYQSTNNGNTWTPVSAPQYTGGLSASFTGMGSQTQDITYTYEAKAVANGVEGPASSSASLQVLWPPTNPVPNALPDQSNGDGSYTVSWAASTGVSPSYSVQVSVADTPYSWRHGCNTVTTSCTVTGGTNGQSYVAKVSSCNQTACNGGNIAPNSVSVWYLAVPAAPTLTSPNYTGTVSMSWSNVTGATSYNLYQSTDGTNYSLLKNVTQGSGSTSTSVSGLAAGTYYYKAAACQTTSICGSQGAAATVSVILPPAAPTGLSISPSTSPNGSFTLSWTAPAAATQYRVYQSTNGGSYAWVDTYNNSNSGTITRAESGLSTGNYSFMVYAANAAGQGPASNTASGTVLLPPPSASIDETDAGDNIHFTLSWSAATATSYTLYTSHATQTGSWTAWAAVPAYTNTTATSDYTASPLGNYYLQYYITACNASGCMQSSAISFQNPREVTGCQTCAGIKPTPPPPSPVPPLASAAGSSPLIPMSLDALIAVQPMAPLQASVRPTQRAVAEGNGSQTRQIFAPAKSAFPPSVAGTTPSRTKAAFWYAPPVYQAYADARVVPASGSSPVVGLTVTYQYNAYGYLNQIVDAVNPNHVYWKATGVNARQQVTDEVYGINGSSTAVTSHRDYYADSGFVQDIQSGTGGTTGVGTGSSLQNLHYTWQELGNLQDRQDNRQGLNEAFGYDALNRLTSATVTNGAGAQPAVTYGYDMLGNLTCKSDVLNTACGPTSGGYTYGGTAGPHAVTSTTTGTSYGYDPDGNMTNRNGTTLVWNADNMPTSIIQDVNNQSTFNYAPDKHRYYQTAKNGGVTETTVYAGGLEIVTNASGTHNRYQLTAYGRSIAIVDLETNAGGAVANTQYLLTDNLGSVDGATDANGALVTGTGWSFEAFGKRRNPATWQTPQAAAQIAADRVSGSSNGLNSGITNRGYTGHEMLDNVGLIHMNGRVYDPALGRFLSVDPVFQFPTNTQSLNPYSYVLNNPLSATDPTGYTQDCSAQTQEGGKCSDAHDEYGSKSGESSRIHEGKKNASEQKINNAIRKLGGLANAQSILKSLGKLGGDIAKFTNSVAAGLQRFFGGNGAGNSQSVADGQQKPKDASSIDSPALAHSTVQPVETDEQTLKAEASLYSEKTTATVDEYKAFYSTMINRVASGDHQYVGSGKDINLDNVLTPHNYHGVGGELYEDFMNGDVSKQALANIKTAVAAVNKNGPVTDATFFIVRPGGKAPTNADMNALGSVVPAKPANIGDIYLYKPAPPGG